MEVKISDEARELLSSLGFDGLSTSMDDDTLIDIEDKVGDVLTDEALEGRELSKLSDVCYEILDLLASGIFA